MMRQKRTRTTLLSVLLISVAGALLCSLVSNFFYYRYARKISDNEILSTTASNGEIAFSNIDKEFMSVANVSALLLSDDNFRQTIMQGNPNAVVEALRGLSNLSQTSSAIIGIDFYYPEDHLVVTGSTNIHYDVDELQVERFLPWFDAYSQSNKTAQFLPFGRNSYPDDNKTITYVAQKPVFAQQAKAVVAIHISPTFFRSFIDETDGHLLLFSEEGCLYETSSDHPYVDIAKTSLDTHHYENTQSLLVQNESEQYLLLEKRSRFLPLSYVYIRRQPDLNGGLPYVKTYLFTVILLVMVNLATVLLIALNGNTIYKNKIRSVVPDDKKSGGESFDQTIDKLKEKFNALNSSYENAQPILVQNTLRLLVLGRAMEYPDSELKTLLPYGECTVAFVKGERMRQRNTALQMAMEQLPTNCRSLFTTVNGETVLILNADSGAMRQVVEKLAGTLSGNGMHLYLGRLQKRTQTAFAIGYKEAQAALSYRYLYPDKPVITIEELAIEHRRTTGPQYKMLSQIEDALMQENETLPLSLLGQYVEALEDNPFTIEYVRGATRDLVTVFGRVVSQRGLDETGIFGYDLREHYEKIKDIREFHVWMEICLKNFYDYLSEKKQNSEALSIKSKIDAIIDASPAKDISLDYIAERIHMRSDELSKLFKTCYGTNYSEFIRTRKIEQAKQMLAEGNLVKEVAYTLGYSTPQYFIKVFKQETGTTPSFYNKCYNGSEDEPTHKG